MSSRVATEALRAHRAAVSSAKREAVLGAIESLVQSGSALTVSAVAREAKVSREFIYSSDPLVSAVRSAAAKQRLKSTREGQALARANAEKAVRAERSLLIDTVERYKRKLQEQGRELASLQEQRRRWLGEKLQPMVDEEAHAALRSANERLTEEVVRLNREAADLKHKVAVLQSDLSASRQAHADTIRELAEPRGLIPLHPPLREQATQHDD